MNGETWSDAGKSWISNSATGVLARIYKIVRLRPDVDKPDKQAFEIAVRATRDAAIAARQRRNWPGYFASKEECSNWLLSVARRGALWRLLHDPAILRGVQALAPKQQRVLSWYYNDQLGDMQISDILEVGIDEVIDLSARH